MAIRIFETTTKERGLTVDLMLYGPLPSLDVAHQSAPLVGLEDKLRRVLGIFDDLEQIKFDDRCSQPVTSPYTLSVDGRVVSFELPSLGVGRWKFCSMKDIYAKGLSPANVLRIVGRTHILIGITGENHTETSSLEGVALISRGTSGLQVTNQMFVGSSNSNLGVKLLGAFISVTRQNPLNKPTDEGMKSASPVDASVYSPEKLKVLVNRLHSEPHVDPAPHNVVGYWANVRLDTDSRRRLLTIAIANPYESWTIDLAKNPTLIEVIDNHPDVSFDPAGDGQPVLELLGAPEAFAITLPSAETSEETRFPGQSPVAPSHGVTSSISHVLPFYLHPAKLNTPFFVALASNPNLVTIATIVPLLQAVTSELNDKRFEVPMLKNPGMYNTLVVLRSRRNAPGYTEVWNQLEACLGSGPFGIEGFIESLREGAGIPPRVAHTEESADSGAPAEGVDESSVDEQSVDENSGESSTPEDDTPDVADDTRDDSFDEFVFSHRGHAGKTALYTTDDLIEFVNSTKTPPRSWPDSRMVDAFLKNEANIKNPLRLNQIVTRLCSAIFAEWIDAQALGRGAKALITARSVPKIVETMIEEETSLAHNFLVGLARSSHFHNLLIQNFGSLPDTTRSSFLARLRKTSTAGPTPAKSRNFWAILVQEEMLTYLTAEPQNPEDDE